MPSWSRNSRQLPLSGGFTLVEILVVVPVVILVVAVMVGFLVTLTGDAMMSRERNAMTYTAQDALNQIEQDVRVSTRFMATTGTLVSPQGRNDGTLAFSSPDQHLILMQYATIGSPYDGTRSLAHYADRPNACDDFHEYNEPVQATVVYFVKNGNLHKRTIIDTNGTVCGALTVPNLWHINSCDITTLNKSRCITRDSILASNVSSFSLSYYIAPDSTSPVSLVSSPRDVTTAEATLTLSKQVAGETIEHSSSIRSSRLNTGQTWGLGN